KTIGHGFSKSNPIFKSERMLTRLSSDPRRMARPRLHRETWSSPGFFCFGSADIVPFSRLNFVQMSVNAAPSNQFIVSAQFTDGSLLHHGNPVSMPDGRKAMRHNQRGAPFQQRFKSRQDVRLRLCIKRAG